MENEDIGLMTFAQHINIQGEIKTKKRFRGGRGNDWDSVERSLFEKLPEKGFLEAFRVCNPNDYSAYSWRFHEKEFASPIDLITYLRPSLLKSWSVVI